MKITEESSPVDIYWTQHTVADGANLDSEQDSLTYLAERFHQYPKFKELWSYEDVPQGGVALDYGCGPGNDIVALNLWAKPAKILGMDVSSAALAIAAKRVAFHGFKNVLLTRVGDLDPKPPLNPSSVDYLNCCGVIGHATYPERLLTNLATVLKPGSRGRIMVYNRDSLYFHMNAAVGAIARGVSTEAFFSSYTDGPSCPYSRAYPVAVFMDMCKVAGLEAEFLGGFFNQLELNHKFYSSLLSEPYWPNSPKGRVAIPEEHVAFLKSVTYEEDRYPMLKDKYAGVFGVYRVVKSSEV